MRYKLLTIIVFCAVYLSIPAIAQEASPGDSCTGSGDTYILSGGPENSGTGHLMTCDGSVWVKVFSFDTTGVIQPQFTNTSSCSDGDELTYNAATGGITCNTACSDSTPNSFNFTDNITASASTLTTSNIRQITGISCQVNVTISGQGSPQYRTCSDSACSTVIQDWTDAPTGLNNNDYIQLRLTTSAIGGDIRQASLSAGNTTDIWNVGPAGDCTDDDPVPGTICPDGTVYAGKSPDRNVKMFTTPCNLGRTWNGSNCTGSSSALPWNNGNSSDYVLTGANSTVSGESNTTILDGLDSDDDATGTPGLQVHRAAQACADLHINNPSQAYGYSDWYLPALQELEVIRAYNNIIPDAGGGLLWVSLELSLENARILRMDNSQQFSTRKDSTRSIRCVRR